MAANIGGVSCSYVTGRVPSWGIRLKTWTRPGMSGVGALDLGDSGERGQIVGVKFDTLTNVNTWAYNIELLQGTLIALENDLGTTWTGVLVHSVRVDEIRSVRRNGVLAARGQCTLEVEQA